MNSLVIDTRSHNTANWRDYVALTKPKVVMVLLITAMVGMLMAPSQQLSLSIFLFGNLGIGLAMAASAAINQLLDQNIDQIMSRTRNRPLVKDKISTRQALIFIITLSGASLACLHVFTNPITVVLTFAGFIGYAGIYTIFLKRATPQNIVIGGLAGAVPPLLGWAAVTGTIDPHALLLVLIIFAWTPPHFWALAIHRVDDYAKAEIPMLPVTHGIEYTKTSIVLYTLLLWIVTLIPYSTQMCGELYLVGSSLLNLRFLYSAWHLKFSDDSRAAINCFKYSIHYILWFFGLLLADKYVLLMM